MKRKRNLLSIILLCIAGILCIFSIRFILKHSIVSPYRIPIIAGGVILTAIVIYQYFHSPKRIATLIDLIVCGSLILSCCAIHILQNNRDALFVEPAKTQERHINFYVMSSSYRSLHSDTFSIDDPSSSIADYADKTFIIQSQYDQDDQATALTDVQNFLEVDELQTITKDTVYDALEALYKGEGDVLVLNQSFISRARQISKFLSFNDDTFILYTITIGNKTDPAVTQTGTSMEPFVCYIAGNDTRNDALTLVGRTDMDMIMAVDPPNKQILLISIPRDFYIENPALENGLDKLTHLGNHGIQNTLNGINQYFDLNITTYLETNFTHFIDLIDTLGGITIQNPYSFTTENAGDYTFPQGEITLNGEEALAYARERYSLEYGDFDRNEHQAILMRGIIEKLQSLSKVGEEATLLTALANDFLTNLDLDDIYNIYKTSLDQQTSWNIIQYHLGGEGTYASTASLGSKKYYVCKPFESQVTFARETINKVLNGEIITQETLPDQENTTYVQN